MFMKIAKQVTVTWQLFTYNQRPMQLIGEVLTNKSSSKFITVRELMLEKQNSLKT